MNNLRRILLVADNPAEAEALKTVFNGLSEDWKVTYCSSQADAVALLGGIDFDVIFADLAAGAVAGTQFLHEVWKNQPKPVRFLLAKTIDADTMVTCVLGAHQFVEKPLDAAKLRAALDRAETIDNLVRNKKIQTLVSGMRTFPARPSLYLEVMKELRSPNADPKVVGQIIAKDLAISTKLIQLVNSACYGLAQNVSDPGQAVMLLGMETTASLILSIEAFSRFDKVKPLYFSVERVWKHSQAVAQSAKRIAEMATGDPGIAHDAYTAGLLHDVGKLAMALNFEEQYQGAMNLAQKLKLRASDVETEVFGANHAEIGAYLLSLWALPFSIIEAVGGHHLPSTELGTKFNPRTAVHIAERLESEEFKADPSAEALVGKEYPPELAVQDIIPLFRQLPSETAEGSDTSNQAAAENIEQSSQAQPLTLATPSGRQIATKSKWKLARANSRKAIFAGAALLAIILLGAGFRMINSGKQKPNEAAPAPVEKLTMPLTSEAASPERATDKELAGPAATQQEPEPAPAPPSELKLQAIMYRGAQSTLIINGRTVRLGDEIEGARIVSISVQDVTIERNGVQQKLSLR